MPLAHTLRYGMVGGGPGAFIGAVHRRAAALDGLARLVGGAFSSDPGRSAAQGRELGLRPERVHADYRVMAKEEGSRPEGERIDFVSIVTPNHLHAPVARAFLEAGIPVVCDKPLTTSLAEAEALRTLARDRGLLFAVTYNYSGYPLVKQARWLVRDGRIGRVRKVVVEYAQGWLATPLESTGQKQAEWRTDPRRAGAGALGDIGSHAEHLARYVTGLEPHQLFAEVTTFVEGRRVDDDATVLFRYSGGAKGMVSCTQIAAGKENDLCLRVHGTVGSLEWRQEEPNDLLLRPADGPVLTFRPGQPHLAPPAKHATRLPSGHPEAFLEAFANIYSNVARTLAARATGSEPDPLDRDFPRVEDGVRGVHFIERALESGSRGDWVDASYTFPEG